MAQRKIQLLRSTSIYATQQLAKDSFNSQLVTNAGLSDGEILLARYVDGADGVKSILGIYNNKNGRSGFTLIVDNETVDALIQGIQNEVDATQAGAGLNENGTYAQTEDTDALEIIGDATSIMGAVEDIAAYVATLEKQADAQNGMVVTTVSQDKGVVDETKEYVKNLQLGGYSKDANATGAIGSTDTINTALSKLENNIAASTTANTVSSSDQSITVTPSASGTDVIVAVDEETIGKENNGELKSLLTITKIDNGLPNDIRERYELQDANGVRIGDQINVYKDSSLYDIYIGHVDDVLTNADAQGQSADTQITSGTGSEALCYVMLLQNQKYKLATVDVEAFLVETEFKDGLQVNANTHEVSVLIDPTSENYLTVSANGVKLDGVDAAIAVETARAQAAEGEIAGLVGLGGTETQRTFTPTTNYGNNAQTVAANLENIDQALSAISATVSGTAYLPSDAISVNQSQQVGHENEYTIELELSDATTQSGDSSYVATGANNVLQIKNDGLYLDSTWDCGEY